MIISKDLFIFGEQIFATIIPEGGSTQASQSQQQQQQQPPAIITTTAAAVAAAATVAAVAVKGAAEPVVVEALSKPMAQTAATPATATPAITATTTTTAALPFSKQETVAVVVAAAAAAAKKANFKIQKIPKETEQLQQQAQYQKQKQQLQQQQQPTKKTREKPQLQQQLQQQQLQINGSSNNEANGGIKINGKKTEEHKATTTPTTTVAVTEQPATRAALKTTAKAAVAIEEDDEVQTDEAMAEKEPLVKRNTIKIAAAAAATIAPTVAETTTITTTVPNNIALQKELLLLAERQSDCRLQLEPEEQPLPLALTLTTANAATIATKTTAAAATATAAVTVAADCCRHPAAPNVAGGPVDFSLNSVGKVMLANNSNSNASSDHAMTVTFPFISEQHRTLQLTFQQVNVLHNERKILSDVSGMVSPGEVLAIMGPSGSGKTTLLDCISGQRHIDSGSILLNREPVSKKWRRKIGYVLQEEVFFTGLTLKETVMYTALLRLPEKMPKSEKVKLVDHILEALELNFCQNTKFGDYLNRGLSGGEKKRANIACELLTNPLLMLLDEPTSGLDSHSAISLMKVLKRYAVQEQKTVVISVHQPSSQMFHMFDKLLLLYNGRTAYYGEVNNIYAYFENIGVAIKPHYNPADFILEQLKCSPDIREKLFVAAKESHGNFLNRNCITAVNTNNHQHHQQHHSNQHSKQNGGITVTSANGGNANSVVVNDKSLQHDTLINDIINNYYYKDVHAMLTDVSCEEAAQHLWTGADSQSTFSSASSDFQREYDSAQDWLDYPTRFPTQFRVLSSRNFKEAKPRMLSKLNWFQTSGLALMAGAIWFQIPRTEEYLHDLQGWMFFSQTYWMLFALFGALNSFPSEREVISKERRSGAYRLSAYYLAKMFGELPLVVTLPTVYLMISYPMLGCTSFKLFFLMLVFLLLNTIVAQSVGFFIGACCMDMNVSITLSALYTLATQLFGGYLSSRIPEGLSWIRYTSMIHYAYQNMQILEFREGSEVRCGSPSSFEICKNNATTFIPYEEILKAQNSTSPLWLNTLVLMMFFMVFRGLGYAVLRYVRCPKA